MNDLDDKQRAAIARILVAFLISVIVYFFGGAAFGTQIGAALALILFLYLTFFTKFDPRI